MTWDWLTGQPVLLIGFIAAVVGLPASITAIVQLLQAAGRMMARRRVERPIIQPNPEPTTPDIRTVPAPPASMASAPVQAERGALSASIPRAYRHLARRALSAGWELRQVGHHVAWISPEGERVLAPTSPRGGEAWEREFMRRLRHAGLDLAA